MHQTHQTQHNLSKVAGFLSALNRHKNWLGLLGLTGGGITAYRRFGGSLLEREIEERKKAMETKRNTLNKALTVAATLAGGTGLMYYLLNKDNAQSQSLAGDLIEEPIQNIESKINEIM